MNKGRVGWREGRREAATMVSNTNLGRLKSDLELFNGIIININIYLSICVLGREGKWVYFGGGGDLPIWLVSLSLIAEWNPKANCH